MRVRKWVTKAGFFLSVIGIAIVVAVGLAFPVKWCWNYLTPLFNGPEITFWQALIMLVLVKLLFTQSNSK